MAQYFTVGNYWRIVNEGHYLDLPKEMYSEQLVQEIVTSINFYDREVEVDKIQAAYDQGYNDGYQDGHSQGWDECCEEYDIVE